MVKAHDVRLEGFQLQILTHQSVVVRMLRRIAECLRKLVEHPVLNQLYRQACVIIHLFFWDQPQPFESFPYQLACNHNT